MILDKENLFIDNAAATTYGTTAKYSDVIANGEGGNAYNPPFLVVCATGAATAGGALTVELQTSDTEAFTTSVSLASYNVPVGAQGEVVQAKLPFSAKKFLRLKLTGSAALTGAAKITAGLVADVDLV